MANINEEARIPVYINDEQAKSALKNLTAEADKWRRKMYEAMSSGDLKGMKDAERELKNVNKQVSQLKREAFDVNKILSNMSSASARDLEKAIQALNREMKGLNRNTKEYTDKKAQLQQLRSELYGVNREIREQRGLFSKTADFVNRYWSVISGAALTLVGIKASIDQATQAFGNFEERVDNLSSLTGLAGEDLEWLQQQAKDLSVSTLEGGIRVKQGAQDIIDAFTKTGSARSELLKNKEALVDVTKEAIILSNASKEELQPSIEALTMVLNQYNEKATESRRIVNALAAGSLEGAGEIPYLTTGIEKSGTVAADADIKIETLVATLETLAPRISQAEIAGRSLKGVILDMQTGADDINPKIVGWTTALENLAKKNLSVTQLTKIFGTENITTAKILLNNIEELKKYEAAVTGTNTAVEQANINTDNRNAKLAQAKNKLENVRIELGEKLAPAMTFSTNSSTYLLKALAGIVSIFFKYGSAIITVTSGVVAYAVATKLAVIWKERENKATLANIVAGKLQAIAYHAQFAAIALYNAAVALLRGNLAKASIQFRAFSAALMANPIGLITGMVVALGFALYSLSGRLTTAQKVQKAVNDVSIDAQKNIVEEKLKLEQLLKIARNEKLSKETRLKAIKDINEMSPEYLRNLTLEKINTDEAKKATDLYTESLLKNAKAQAAKEKLVEIEKQLIDLQNGEGAEPNFWQKTWNGIVSGGNAAVFAVRNANTALDNLNKKEKELIETRNKLTDSYLKEDAGSTSTSGGNGGGGGEDEQAQDLIALKEKELANAKAIIATTPAEVAARNRKVEAIQNEINKLNQLGTSKEGKAEDPIIKNKIEALDAAYAAEKALINRNHLEGKISEDQYNAELLQAELKFYAEKLKIYKVGSKEYEEAVNKGLELQVQIDKTIKDLLLKAEKELADAKIENISDAILQEEEKELQRWANEKAAIEKQILDKENLSQDEIKLNETIYAILEEGEKQHQKRMRKLKSGKNIGDLENLVEAAAPVDENFSTPDQQQAFFNARLALIQAQYEKEKELAGKNKAALLAADKKYQRDSYQVKSDQIDAEFALTETRIAAAQNYVSMLAGVVDQESALGKALFLFNQGLAIGEVWINIAKANAKAIAASPLTLGQPWVGINTTQGAIQTGVILAQTIAKFTKGKAEGGYTEPGGKYEPAGIVHKGEYVIPQEGVNNTAIRPIIDIMEIARRNGNLARLDLRPVVQLMGQQKQLYTGGFAAAVSASPAANPAQSYPTTIIDVEKFDRAVEKLINYKPELVLTEVHRRLKKLENKYEQSKLT